MVTIPDYNTILAQVLAFFRNRFPGRDTHSESFLGKAARALSRTIAYLLVSLQSVDQDAVPSQKTSFTALANMAFAYGIPSNAGGYGPNGATAATGGLATFTGTNGQPIPDGTLCTAPDGVTILKTSGLQTIPGVPPGSGQVTVNIVAVTPGSAGNISAGQTINLQAPPAGIDGTALMTTGTANGLDSEAATSLLARIFSRWQSPPKGGTGVDYRTWSEEIAGVSRAYVYPNREGTGTVDIVIVSAGTGTGRKPSSAVQTSVLNLLNGNSSITPAVVGVRPVTAAGTSVLLPYMPSGLAIRVRVVPSATKYAFDWALGSSTFTVTSYNAGTYTLTMGQAIPMSLQTAINNYIANPTTPPPRLQVISTGMTSPVATPVYAVSFNAGAQTITLQQPAASWTAPTIGDPVYPYGPVVPIIAAGSNAAVVGGVQGYIDSLGPSRASGLANAYDVWNDTASIFGVGEVALDTTDTDGVTKPASRLLGVTINGGTSDVQATDTTSGVQLLYCSSIAITD